MRLAPFTKACLLYWLFASPWVLCSPLSRKDSPGSTSSPDLISVLSSAAQDPVVDDKVSDTVSKIISSIAGDKNIYSTEDAPVQQAWRKIEAIFTSSTNATLSHFAHEIIASGLIPSNILTFLNDYLNAPFNSVHNLNPSIPVQLMIYPFKAAGDAPYSITEGDLRAAVYLPASFMYGQNGTKPIILVPGTAAPGGTAFHSNLAKLGSAIPGADVVWVNVPQASLGDVQVNAEYIAYAINYVSTLSQSPVTVISWSQGGLNTQWAFKYWPSTRHAVYDFIAVSPDFRGTVVSTLACPWLAGTVCTPALWQQGWDTKFVRTLRATGGDSAYVPTTTIYSSFDEIVQLMSGRHASAILQNTHGVGVSNNHLQTICAYSPAGGVYPHEGVLYNPLTWALIVDALSHEGPGDPSRLDLHQVCGQLLPPQLGLDDMLGTEGLVLVALSEVVRYKPKTFKEPDIQGYAS
ncbi:lipase [Aspergillus heteromorphus CBS 117.55]|uniref:Lipase n=1 Tax=Aspergillus heteromorphus CBS 117.55 TaxID=1448321 RepID=A0A317V9N3_9EURO|nr:lipase [Aspergillus heteromorphus CBS 117.55]PWY69582.1 lipase [Aspergillus heteromorphus CBS 117.55]